MKDGKLLISTVLYNVHPVVYSSQFSMIYRTGKNLSNWEMIFFSPIRMPIDSARNAAARYALQLECDYLFFYDDDMFLHPDIIERLLKRMNDETHVVMARCYIRGFPFHPMIFKYETIENKGESYKALGHYVDYKDDVRKDGLVEVDAVGCACTMIDVKLFKMIPEPWFMTGKTHTEDVYFCVKAKDHVEGVGLFMDDTFECGHLMERPILTEHSREILTDLDHKGLNQVFFPKSKKELIFNYDNPLEEGDRDGSKN